MNCHFPKLLFMLSLIIGVCIPPLWADLHSKNKEDKIMDTKLLFELLTVTKGSVYQAYRNQLLANKAANQEFLLGVESTGDDW
jgi:hypothetical protein